jgi:hypothetical protein
MFLVSFILLLIWHYYYYYYCCYYSVKLRVLMSDSPSYYYPSTSCYSFCSSSTTAKPCPCSCMLHWHIPLLIAYIPYSMRIIAWNLLCILYSWHHEFPPSLAMARLILTTWALLRGIFTSYRNLSSADNKEKPIFTVCSTTRFTGCKHRLCTDTLSASPHYVWPAFILETFCVSVYLNYSSLATGIIKSRFIYLFCYLVP